MVVKLRAKFSLQNHTYAQYPFFRIVITYHSVPALFTKQLQSIEPRFATSGFTSPCSTRDTNETAAYSAAPMLVRTVITLTF